MEITEEVFQIERKDTKIKKDLICDESVPLRRKIINFLRAGNSRRGRMAAASRNSVMLIRKQRKK